MKVEVAKKKRMPLEELLLSENRVDQEKNRAILHNLHDAVEACVAWFSDPDFRIIISSQEVHLFKRFQSITAETLRSEVIKNNAKEMHDVLYTMVKMFVALLDLTVLEEIQRFELFKSSKNGDSGINGESEKEVKLRVFEEMLKNMYSRGKGYPFWDGSLQHWQSTKELENLEQPITVNYACRTAEVDEWLRKQSNKNPEAIQSHDGFISNYVEIEGKKILQRVYAKVSPLSQRQALQEVVDQSSFENDCTYVFAVRVDEQTSIIVCTYASEVGKKAIGYPKVLDHVPYISKQSCWTSLLMAGLPLFPQSEMTVESFVTADSVKTLTEVKQNLLSFWSEVDAELPITDPNSLRRRYSPSLTQYLLMNEQAEIEYFALREQKLKKHYQRSDTSTILGRPDVVLTNSGFAANELALNMALELLGSDVPVMELPGWYYENSITRREGITSTRLFKNAQILLCSLSNGTETERSQAAFNDLIFDYVNSFLYEASDNPEKQHVIIIDNTTNLLFDPAELLPIRGGMLGMFFSRQDSWPDNVQVFLTSSITKQRGQRHRFFGKVDIFSPTDSQRAQALECLPSKMTESFAKITKADLLEYPAVTNTEVRGNREAQQLVGKAFTRGIIESQETLPKALRYVATRQDFFCYISPPEMLLKKYQSIHPEKTQVSLFPENLDELNIPLSDSFNLPDHRLLYLFSVNPDTAQVRILRINFGFGQTEQDSFELGKAMGSKLIAYMEHELLSVELAYALAEQARENDEAKSAISIAEYAHRLFPDSNLEYSQVVARLYLRAEEFAKAEQAYEIILRESGRRTSGLLCNLAVTKAMSGKFSEAVENLISASELGLDETDFIKYSLYKKSILKILHEADFPLIVRLQQNPSLWKAMQLVMTDFMEDRTARNSVILLEKCVSAIPTELWFRKKLIGSYFFVDEHENLVATVEMLQAQGESLAVAQRCYYGVSLYKTGNIDDALTQLLATYNQKSNEFPYSRAAMYACLCLAQSSNADLIRQACTKPFAEMVYSGVEDVLDRENVSTALKVIEVLNTNAEEVLPKYRSRLAFYLLLNLRFDDAIEIYRSLLAEHGPIASWYGNLGKCFFLKGEYQTANDLLEQSYQVNKEWAHYTFRYLYQDVKEKLAESQ